MGILSDENAMCDEHYRNDNCDQCPIRMAAKAKMTSCMVYKINNEDETIKMIEDWKVNHKTLIPEPLKKTLKSLYALGYRTVSKQSFNGIRCSMKQSDGNGITTVFPNNLNSNFTVLKIKEEYEISDLIDKAYLEEVETKAPDVDSVFNNNML